MSTNHLPRIWWMLTGWGYAGLIYGHITFKKNTLCLPFRWWVLWLRHFRFLQRFTLEGSWRQVSWVSHVQQNLKSQTLLKRGDRVFIGRIGYMDFEMIIWKYFFDVSNIPKKCPRDLISLPHKTLSTCCVAISGSVKDCDLAATYFQKLRRHVLGNVANANLVSALTQLRKFC